MVPILCFEEDGTPYIQLGVYILKLDIEEFEGEWQERARLELRETEENKEEGIIALRTLLENEPGLEIPMDENDFLLKFLRPCKYYPESAFKLMKRYYKFKLKHPNLGADLVPSVIAPTIKQGIASFLPSRDKTGCRIMVSYLGSKWNTKACKLQDLFRAVMMFIEIAMAEPRTQLAGVQVIFDMNGLSINHVYQFGPKFARTLLEWVQECIPLRLKGIHIVNEPKIFNILFAIFKPFLIEKLRKRIFFHGSHFDKLNIHIGSDALPVCYGGTMEIPELPGSLLADLLSHYEEDFQILLSTAASDHQNAIPPHLLVTLKYCRSKIREIIFPEDETVTNPPGPEL